MGMSADVKTERTCVKHLSCSWIFHLMTPVSEAFLSFAWSENKQTQFK